LGQSDRLSYEECDEDENETSQNFAANRMHTYPS
jgi:hypothetical protein